MPFESGDNTKEDRDQTWPCLLRVEPPPRMTETRHGQIGYVVSAWTRLCLKVESLIEFQSLATKDVLTNSGSCGCPKHLSFSQVFPFHYMRSADICLNSVNGLTSSSFHRQLKNRHFQGGGQRERGKTKKVP